MTPVRPMQYGILLLTVAACVLPALRAAGQQAGNNQPLTLSKVLEAARASWRNTGIEEAAAGWSNASFTAADRNLGGWNIEAEATLGTGDREDRERRAGIFVEKSMRLGVDREAMRRQFTAEAQSVALDSEHESTGQLILAGHAFIHLIHYRRLALMSGQMLATLNPLLAGAAQAVSRGGTEALSLLKWKILSQEISAAGLSADANFRMTASQLSQATGLSVPEDLKTAQLESPVLDAGVELNAGQSPRIRSLLARSAGARHRAEAAAGTFALSAGLGMERDFHGEANAVVARVAIPIGQGSLNEAARSEALAQGTLLEKQAELARQSLLRELQHLHHRISVARGRIRTLELQRDEVAKLYRATIDGLRQGLADLGQVVESSEKLFQLETELSQAICDMQGEGLELRILSGGKL